MEIRLNMCTMQKQEGSNDCGVFSTAVITAITHGIDPSKLKLRNASAPFNVFESANDEIISDRITVIQTTYMM